jgi:predicted nucleic acid-binding protein
MPSRLPNARNVPNAPDPVAALGAQPSFVVLDTNVVLDWLLFGDAACTGLVASVQVAQVRWCATEAMRDELAHVLDRGHWDAWEPQPQAIWAAWDRWCTVLSAPVVRAPRCTDPNDQKFIDLALGAPARWLVSRDRAVLALARRLRPLGTQVLTPAGWGSHSP